MALIAEDGTGLANAESYISVADADTRHSAMGNTDWAALGTTAKEQALRRATDYMTGAYRQRWHGRRVASTQALDWPRSWVCVDGWGISTVIVPDAIKNACADLALKATTEELAPDLERAVIREKVDVIETEYSPYASQQKRYPAVEMMLAPYLARGGNSMLLVRT